MATMFPNVEDRAIWDHAHEAKVCTAADLFDITGADDAPEGYLESIDAYLSNFAAPIYTTSGGGETKYQTCLHCDGLLGGMFGGFEWGICHGEGHCGFCGWPARAHHFAKDADGKELFTLRNYALQYLPDADAEAVAKAEAA